MSSLRRQGRRATAVVARVALAPLAIAVGALSPALSVHAATASHPACRASQITVTAGATATTTTYTVRTATGLHQVAAYEAVPVDFFNRGATCHLLMGAPQFLAVRGIRGVVRLSALSAHDVSVPVGADNTRRPVVAHHRKIEALFVVAKPVRRSLAGCDPATTLGIVVQGYAKPVGTFSFIARRLRDVCFDTGVGRRVVNDGAVWPTT
ncbi:MAG: hypothetical protein ACP5OV_07615 [Acidimicrobiales bacterium]